jgi:tRNA pseudouridine55 synthase
MDGVLVIDKPPAWTSHDVVAKIRNITRIRKVGHTGTLDPFATGVLPLTMGRATRLTNYFLSSDKHYRGVMRFGFATTTFDLEGEPVGEDARPDLDRESIEALFRTYVGTIRQTVPPYSARKIRGKPMYAYARKGIEMEPATKEVRIKTLTLLDVRGSEVEFELSCTAGTYARSLAHDLGRDWGCGAHLVSLRRTRSGEFPIDTAVRLEEAGVFHTREFFLEHILPMGKLLQDIPTIVVPEADRNKLVHGADLNLLTGAYESDEYRLLDEAGVLLAVAQRLHTFASPVAQPAHWVRVHPRIIFG